MSNSMTRFGASDRFGILTSILPLVFLFLSSSAFSQEKLKPLTIDVSTMQPSVALGRPMLTWWDVKIAGSGLVVGEFEFRIKSEERLLGTAVTEEMTLNGPEQRIRLMLPAINSPYTVDQLKVDISFRGKKFSGSLGEQILRIPFFTKKVFIALVGESRVVKKKTAQREKVIERLRYENLLAKPKRMNDASGEFLKTVFASIDPSDFPAEPLAYCGYDLIVLMGAELPGLRAQQLDALLAWIKAGGSLYVEPNGVLENHHVKFLRNLVAESDHGIIIQTDSAGKLPRDTVPFDQAAVVVPCGLGHVVIRTSDPDQEIDATDEAWRAIVGPLWKMRFQPPTIPTAPGFVVGPDGDPKMVQDAMADWRALSELAMRRFRLSQSELLSRLMPEGVRMVPTWILAAVLFLFVLLIGPGDYFILGWLKTRKLTWVTFPLTTLGVTVLTVFLSNYYMSASETRRSVVVRDLGLTGEVVRTNRFELLYFRSSRRATTEIERGLFSSLSPKNDGNVNSMMYAQRMANLRQRQLQQQFAMNGQRNPFSGMPFINEEQVELTEAQVQGRIPTQFVVTQDLAKWTPQLNRIFSIPAAASKSEIDWSAFQLNQSELNSIRGHVIPPRLVEQVRLQFGPQALVACFWGSDGWAYDRTTGWMSSKNAANQNPVFPDQAPMISTANVNIGQLNADDAALDESGLFRWIYHASVAPQNSGMFTLIKQTTPKGGANCDDLPIMDSSDPKSWLLVVVVSTKDESVVHRKLMRL